MKSDPTRAFWVTALGLLLLGACASPSAAAEISWKEQFYNPKAQGDDLVLPMPCGGAMTFRPVLVPAEHLLGDRRVTFGGADERFGFSEDYRREFVAGAFAGGDGGRLYYVGKYEVTTDQYKAITEADCAAPSNLGRLPKTAVAWIEAEDFAAHYTEWLLANAADRLPSEDDVRGFLRLPTEAEWEYAARGGSAVSESEFLRPLFPMDGPLSQYAWYGSPDSSNFKAQPIGLLKPNPAGLHDVLGNAAELVLDPFRLNKVARLHGQAGGITAKGGDYLTPQDAIRTAQRDEINPYDKGGLRRVETVGFRLVIGAPVLTSPTRLESVRAEWHDLPKSESPLAGTERLADPLEEVDLLIKSTEDEVLKERLQGLHSVIEQNIASRNEQRDRSTRAMLQFGAFLTTRIRDANRLVAARDQAVQALLEVNDKDDEVVKKQQEAADRARDALDVDLGYYQDLLAEIAQDYPLRIVEEQIEVLRKELESRDRKKLIPFADLVLAHLVKLHEAGELASQGILDDLTSIQQ